jgi:TolB-like protein/Flp pilus assembly protein TadD
LLVIIVVGGFLGYRYFEPAGSEQINSIAVLPFENRSGSADTDYLSDGLAESLIYRLSQLPTLKVSPTSSVMRFKSSQADVSQIAQQLDVDAVMFGRLAQRGDDLTIGVELIDARTNKVIWAEQYDRKMADLMATQREIATAITQKLELKLSGDEAKGITKKYTDSNEAYRHYLQGRFYWNKRTPDGNAKAIEQFKAAIDTDPNFALAYSGLADGYLLSQYLTRRWQGDFNFPAARQNAERAIKLDASLAEPHAALALIDQQTWQWEDAEKEFKTALSLNPNYATTHHWYSRFLRIMGRYDEARAEITKAQEADPLSLVIAENVVQNLLEKGDVESAINQCKRAMELDPQFWIIHLRLSAAYLESGQKEEALAEATKGAELVNRVTIALAILGYTQGVAGKREDALATAQELERRFAGGEGDGLAVGAVYMGLGDNDRAFEWLEKDVAAKRPSTVEIFLEPEFRSLRSDPRFRNLRRRMGLQE